MKISILSLLLIALFAVGVRAEDAVETADVPAAEEVVVEDVAEEAEISEEAMAEVEVEAAEAE